MNWKAREYIENHLQPWRYPAQVKARLGKQATNPVPLFPNIEAYFQRFFNFQATEDTCELLFELELVGLYNALASCLPDDHREFFEKHVAFGACFTNRAGAAVSSLQITPKERSLAILWDFKLDDLLTFPTVLYSARQNYKKPLIPLLEAGILSNMGIASAGLGKGIYVEPCFALDIDRTWINHMVWGMTAFIIAHEMSHIIHSHYIDAPVKHMRCMSREEGFIDIDTYSRSQQQEFQADATAVELLINGIDRGILKQGYTLWLKNPFEAMYHHIRWMFAIFTASEILWQRLGNDMSALSTHPTATDRTRIALGHLLHRKGEFISTHRNSDEVANSFCKIASEGPFLTFDEDKFEPTIFLEAFPAFYDPIKYVEWLKSEEENV